jgi:hypothetical protein
LTTVRREMPVGSPAGGGAELPVQVQLPEQGVFGDADESFMAC